MHQPQREAGGFFVVLTFCVRSAARNLNRRIEVGAQRRTYAITFLLFPAAQQFGDGRMVCSQLVIPCYGISLNLCFNLGTALEVAGGPNRPWTWLAVFADELRELFAVESDEFLCSPLHLSSIGGRFALHRFRLVKFQ